MMETNQDLLSTGLQVDARANIHLRETAKWGKFLGILGFIFSVLIALGGIGVGYMTSLANGFPGGSAARLAIMNPAVLAAFYEVIAVVYFFMSVFLYQFATKMISALNNEEQQLFNDSLLNLKKLYRMMGIIAIIYLALIVLVVIAVIMAAAYMR